MAKLSGKCFACHRATGPSNIIPNSAIMDYSATARHSLLPMSARNHTHVPLHLGHLGTSSMGTTWCFLRKVAPEVKSVSDPPFSPHLGLVSMSVSVCALLFSPPAGLVVVSVCAPLFSPPVDLVVVSICAPLFSPSVGLVAVSCLWIAGPVLWVMLLSVLVSVCALNCLPLSRPEYRDSFDNSTGHCTYYMILIPRRRMLPNLCYLW